MHSREACALMQYDYFGTLNRYKQFSNVSAFFTFENCNEVQIHAQCECHKESSGTHPYVIPILEPCAGQHALGWSSAIYGSRLIQVEPFISNCVLHIKW